MRFASVSLLVASIASIAPAQPGTFTATGSVPSPTYFNSAVRLQDGRVLYIGAGNSASIYDPQTGSFSATTGLTTERVFAMTALLPNGQVLIAGGDASHSAELYDPATNTFTRVGNLARRQLAGTAVLLKNGKVLIAGGLEDGCCPATASNPELFDPATATFSLTGPYQEQGDKLGVSGGPFATAVVPLADGRVLVAGEPHSEIFDPDTDTFSLTSSMIVPCVLPEYISGATATVLRNGQVLFTGGDIDDCGFVINAQLYDPVTNKFTLTGSMSRMRHNHTATLLADGKVLIAGGETADCNGPVCTFFGTIPSAELYDPQTATFTAAGDMVASRAGHTATLLANGQVLFVGGYAFSGINTVQNYFCCVALAEIYTPSHSGRREGVR